jgi:hypothetical protein
MKEENVGFYLCIELGIAMRRFPTASAKECIDMALSRHFATAYSENETDSTGEWRRTSPRPWKPTNSDILKALKKFNE